MWIRHYPLHSRELPTRPRHSVKYCRLNKRTWLITAGRNTFGTFTLSLLFVNTFNTVSTQPLIAFFFSEMIVMFRSATFLRPLWLFLNSCAYLANTKVYFLYVFHKKRNNLFPNSLVKAEIPYFLYLSRKRRDIYMANSFLSLRPYFTQKSVSLYYKDQWHKCKQWFIKVSVIFVRSAQKSKRVRRI
jgi:hypothetical protein